MEIRKSKKSTTYREMIVINGKVVKSPSYTRKTDAIKWKASKLAEREHYKLHGISPIQNGSKILFKDQIYSWLNNKVRVKNTRRTYINYKNIIDRHLIPFFGLKYLSEIEDKHLTQFCLKLKENGNNNKGINIILGVMKVMYNDALLQKLIIQTPFSSFKNLPMEQRDYLFWSKQEIQQFLVINKNDELYEFYLVALYTGMRRGELAGLCFDSIDFRSNTITVSRTRDKFGLRNTTKNKLIRHIPIHPQVKSILQKLMNEKRNEKFVFAHKNGSPLRVHHVYRMFKAAQIKAKMDKLIRFHDLRHTFATQFMVNGGSLFDLKQVLGHGDIKMTQRYAHHSPDHLQSSVKFFGLGDDLEQKENVLTLI